MSRCNVVCESTWNFFCVISYNQLGNLTNTSTLGGNDQLQIYPYINSILSYRGEKKDRWSFYILSTG